MKKKSNTTNKKLAENFWTQFSEYWEENSPPCRKLARPSENIRDFKIGRIGKTVFFVRIERTQRKEMQRVALVLVVEGGNPNERIEHFKRLEKEKHKIESEIGEKFEDWKVSGEGWKGVQSTIKAYRKCKPNEESDWPRQNKWFVDTVEKFVQAFGSRIKSAQSKNAKQKTHSTASQNEYEQGRLNLPFVGLCTFGKYPHATSLEGIPADIAVLGAPFDCGTQYRTGARFGPRGVREASTLFSFGHSGAYDFEDDILYLRADTTKIIDVGDADIVHTDTEKSHANIEASVRAILDAGALPIVIGGDHSVNIPCIRAFDGRGPIHVVQIDAHLDFVDVRHGVRHGHGNPMRRASECGHVSGMTQIGIRNVSSSNRDDYEAARKAGSTIFSVRDFRRLGPAGVLESIPAGACYYCTIDIDGFDPSIAPGTGTPSHGGFLYYEVLELLDGLCKRGEVVGADLVEVAPDYDPSGSTSFLAAQILLNFIGRILHNRTS